MSIFINVMLFAFGLSLFTQPVVSKEKEWYAPNRIVSQHGGFIGYLSLGVEYDINDRYSTSLIGGYVPEVIGGEDLWSITWKNNFDLISDELLTPYIGTGLVYSLDRDTYLVLPQHYPDGYYPPTAYYFMFYAGLNLQIKDRYSIYFELSTLDYYLEVKGRNYCKVSWEDISTWGVGYKLDL